MELANQVVDIQLLNIESRFSEMIVDYTQIFRDGNRRTCRTNVRDLGGYYGFFSPKPIVIATCMGKVNCGAAWNDTRILFVVKLEDGSAQLIQVREGSQESLKLLELSGEAAKGRTQLVSVPKSQGNNTSVKPYPLGKNELPQGSYLIGRDIPAGTYDFFVVYGFGGKFDIGKYDANDKVIDGTWNFFWVGKKEDYEKRELIHIQCKEGYTLKISGNVILKIARSQPVKIDL